MRIDIVTLFPAVSYTHLDVYKRQEQEQCRAFGIEFAKTVLGK